MPRRHLAGILAKGHSLGLPDALCSLSGELADPLMTFWALLWMSMSYGFTNFAFIWLCLLF